MSFWYVWLSGWTLYRSGSCNQQYFHFESNIQNDIVDKALVEIHSQLGFSDRYKSLDSRSLPIKVDNAFIYLELYSET